MASAEVQPFSLEVKRLPLIAPIPANLSDQLAEDLLAGMLEVQNETQQMIRQKDKGAFGTMLASFATTVSLFGENTVMARVGSMQVDSYASHVEFGTRPHFPPVRALFKWVEKKFMYLQMGVSFDTGRAVPTRKGTKLRFPPRGRQGKPGAAAQNAKRDKAIMRIARAIAFKISQRGTPPSRFMSDALTRLGIRHVAVFDGTVGGRYQLNIADVLKRRNRDFWDKVVRRRK